MRTRSSSTLIKCARRHAALGRIENSRKSTDKQSARMQMRRIERSVRIIDGNDDHGGHYGYNMLSARRHAAYCFVDCSALLSRRRAARPAMRRALHLRNDRAGSPTDRPTARCCLLPSFASQRGEKGEKKGTTKLGRRVPLSWRFNFALFVRRGSRDRVRATRTLKNRSVLKFFDILARCPLFLARRINRRSR